MSTAVAMKYSSHEGRCGKLLAASAIRSTGRTGTAGSAGVSGGLLEGAERLMNVARTLDRLIRPGNLRLQNTHVLRVVLSSPGRRLFLQRAIRGNLPFHSRAIPPLHAAHASARV